MSGWDEAQKETAGSGGAGGDFLKIEDGETAVLSFLGEPKTYLAKPFVEGKPPSKRVLLNVFVASAKARKVIDLSGPTFQELLESRAKFPFEKWMIAIKRKGTGKNTRYTILPEKELSDAQKKFLATLELVDLEELASRICFKGEEPQSRQSYSRPADRTPAQTQSVQQGMQIDDESLPF